MKTNDKEQIILNAIYERAHELEAKAIVFLEMTTESPIDYNLISAAALKKALQEWQENKPVFNL